MSAYMELSPGGPYPDSTWQPDHSLENLTAPAPSMKVLGSGQSGEVVYFDADPGYCYKFPRVGVSPRAALRQLQHDCAVHDALVQLGFPTITEFEVIEHEDAGTGTQSYAARMTDLSEGGRNLVFSDPDVVDVPIGDRDVWFRRRWNGPAVNASAFFTQLEDIVTRAALIKGTAAGLKLDGLRITRTGFFLVASPEGILQVRIGDFHDGVDRTSNRAAPSGVATNHPSYYHGLGLFLTGVTFCFPELRPEATSFLTAISHGLYSTLPSYYDI